jgi:hypothetical protein
VLPWLRAWASVGLYLHGVLMNEQTKKELLKAIYNGALDAVKLAVRDWKPNARANFYAFLERLKK